ncbi:MAG: diguanylate cyclase [Bacilli bacterium]|nr:diguanylate cyclase [Bacilli bacterium]
MNSYFRIDINVISAVLLAVILVIAYKRLDRKDKLSQAFFTTSIIIIFQLLIEAATCLINMRQEPWVYVVANLLHIVLFITAPILTMYWYLLLRKLINPNDQIKKKIFVLISIPLMINMIFVLLSPFFKFMFYIDDANVYQRGNYFFISAIISYGYLIFGLIRIAKNTSKIVRRDLNLMFISTIIPIVGGILQSFIYGILLMWSSVAFALIIVYLFLQQRLVHLDNLTGVWNRESFYYYIEELFKKNMALSFGAIYIDVDNLKGINDNYGHFEGDFALQETSRIIKSILFPSDVLARVGGDEFVILSMQTSNDQLNILNMKLKEAFSIYNDISNKPYQITVSTGKAIYSSNFNSFEQFVRHIDHLMYEEKNTKYSPKD